MEYLIPFLHLAAFILFVAWPFCIVSNYLLKKKIITPTTQQDSSGWLSGAVFSAQSSLFGFLSATLVAVLVTQRVSIITSSDKEASTLSSLLTLSQSCDFKTKTLIRDTVEQYTQHVISKEWSLMNQKNTSWKKGRQTILDLRKNLTIGNRAHNKQIMERILDRTNDLLDRRIERIQSARSHIPQYVWAFLYVSAILVLMGPGFYALNRYITHLFLMFAVSTVVCTTLMSLHYLQPHYSIQTKEKIGAIYPSSFLDILQNIKEDA